MGSVLLRGSGLDWGLRNGRGQTALDLAGPAFREWLAAAQTEGPGAVSVQTQVHSGLPTD